MEKYNINPKPETPSIKALIDNIDKGYKLQETTGELTEDEILSYTGAIIITPDYQREYRFKLEDEAKLVESVLVKIPIPPIFLASDKYKEVKVRNVVDGQHRLRALHRFYNNKFKLDTLELLPDLNGKYFKDLTTDEKTDFIDAKISVTIFDDFPGGKFEMEIFSRYNKGTKPLSPQEIRHAAYNSRFNIYVNDYVKKIRGDEDKAKLANAYNISLDRIQKKKVQEGIFVILSILENGINEEYSKSLVYAEEYMKEKKELERTNAQKADESFDEMRKRFEKFNEIIEAMTEVVEYPFSRELYGISSRNYKFQISIAMILAGIFNKIYLQSEYIEKIISDKEELIKFVNKVGALLQSSYLEDPEYNASSTNSKKMKELVEKFCVD